MIYKIVFQVEVFESNSSGSREGRVAFKDIEVDVFGKTPNAAADRFSRVLGELVQKYKGF